MIKNLSDLNIQKIFFGSGDRNSPLLKHFDEHLIEVGLDERSLAFQALGFAKLTGRPTAICVTSGTAVGECLPALIEAYYAEIPLIIITADRPSPLRNTRAPQAIDQVNIFGRYVNCFYDGNLEDFSLEEISYPLHLNIAVQKEKFITQINQPISEAKKILAVFCDGSDDLEKEYDKVLHKGFHIFNEVNSGLLKEGTVQYERTLLREMQSHPFDIIIKFGRTPLTKLWRLLNEKYAACQIFSYNNDFCGLARGKRIDDLSALPTVKREELVEPLLSPVLDKYPLSEVSIVRDILAMTNKDHIIYAGNSMPIRYLDFFKNKDTQVMASRGANGIDGQVSTAIGIAKASKQMVHALLGDLTFLYDHSCLSWPLPENLIIHVLDNKGGRIFDRVQSDDRMILPPPFDLSNEFSHPQLKIYPVDNEQTQKFWDEWNVV